MHIRYPVSQEILSLGNSVAATIFPKEIMSLSIIEATVFPKEIMSLPGNSVARTKHVANFDRFEKSHT